MGDAHSWVGMLVHMCVCVYRWISPTKAYKSPYVYACLYMNVCV